MKNRSLLVLLLAVAFFVGCDTNSNAEIICADIRGVRNLFERVTFDCR